MAATAAQPTPTEPTPDQSSTDQPTTDRTTTTTSGGSTATGGRPNSGQPKKRGSLAHRLYTGDIAYPFVQHWKRWFALSGTLLLISLVALGVRHLNLGIEFKGGTDFTATAPITSTTTNDVRQAVLDTGLAHVDGTSVTTVGGNTVKAETRSLSGDEVAKVRTSIANSLHVSNDKVAYNLIGPSWGKQITGKALQALIVFLVLVMLLIWAYFRDWRMSVAAIIALLHDLVLTVGLYALVGFEVSSATVIGVLTILGYSLYDTVVVFDKVRENVSGITKTRRSYSDAANDAVNQTLVRSLNTTLIGVLPVAAILFAGAFYLGSGPLEDLGLALFVGMISGAYSSIFIATPLLAMLKERSPEMRQHREQLASRGRRDRRRNRQVQVAAAGQATSPSKDRPHA